jgi:hypothetical protein
VADDKYTVHGLARFREHFAGFTDQYVLIGGIAASITMAEAGDEFRPTRDLDIVLMVEAITPDFVRSFWEFVRAGQYEIQHKTDSTPILFRFEKPSREDYPFQLELFSRKPDGVELPSDVHLTPITVDDSVSNLSAILLDETYYQFVVDGRRRGDGLVWIGEDRLIPLKASAWLDMTDRVRDGATIDSKNIRKHAVDVLRLSRVLTEESRIELPRQVAADLERFLDAQQQSGALQQRAIELGGASLGDVCDRIRRAFGLVHQAPAGNRS